MIEGVINKSNSEFKDVLTAANSDYLELPSVLTQNDNTTFKIIANLTATDLQLLCNNGTSTHRLRTNTNGSVFVSLPSGNDTSTTGLIVTGLNTIELIRASGVNSLSVNGNTPQVLTGATDAFDLFRFNNRSGAYSDFDILEFEFNNETFKPSGNGLTYKGSNGTVVTRNTSALDPVNYINQTLIQKIYGSDLNYKDVLTDANIDYLSSSHTVNWANTDNINISYTVDWRQNIGTIAMFYNFDSPFNFIRLVGAGSNRINLRVQVDGVNTIDTTTATLPTGKVLIEIKNGQLFVEGVPYLTIPSTASPSWNKQFTSFVGYSGFITQPITEDIFDFTINSETFKPSGNGLTYKGSNGTVVTRNTSALDPINYYNLTAIQKV